MCIFSGYHVPVITIILGLSTCLAMLNQTPSYIATKQRTAFLQVIVKEFANILIIITIIIYPLFMLIICVCIIIILF